MLGKLQQLDGFHATKQAICNLAKGIVDSNRKKTSSTSASNGNDERRERNRKEHTKKSKEKTISVTGHDLHLLINSIMRQSVDHATQVLVEKEEAKQKLEADAREAAGYNIDLNKELLNLLSEKFAPDDDERHSSNSFQVKAWNGRDTSIAVRGFTTTPETFVKEAKRSKWVDDFLPHDHDKIGLCKYFAKYHTDIYESVAKKDIPKEFETITSLAMAQDLGLGKKDLERLKQWMKPRGTQIHVRKKDVDAIDRDVGVDNPMIFGVKHVFFDKSDPKPCPYYNLDLAIEVETELRLYLLRLLAKNKGMKQYETVGYSCPGVVDGCQILFGGDMGHHVFRMHFKLHCTSPAIRKEMKDLVDYECEANQIAYLQCHKDTHETLHDSIMPKLNSDILKLQKSCAVVVYNQYNLSMVDVLVLGDTFKETTVMFDQEKDDDGNILSTTMTYKLDDDPLVTPRRRVKLSAHVGHLEVFRFKWKKIVNLFYDLYFGDNAFLATLLGMDDADGSGCLSCFRTLYKFVTHQCVEETKRMEYLEQCLLFLATA